MKKGSLALGIAAAAALSIALLGCQTAKPVTGENSIQTEQTGLAPNGDKQHSTIDFSLVFSNKEAIKGWKVEMVTGSGPQKQWSGDAKNLPGHAELGRTQRGGHHGPRGQLHREAHGGLRHHEPRGHGPEQQLHPGYHAAHGKRGVQSRAVHA